MFIHQLVQRTVFQSMDLQQKSTSTSDKGAAFVPCPVAPVAVIRSGPPTALASFSESCFAPGLCRSSPVRAEHRAGAVHHHGDRRSADHSLRGVCAGCLAQHDLILAHQSGAARSDENGQADSASKRTSRKTASAN